MSPPGVPGSILVVLGDHILSLNTQVRAYLYSLRQGDKNDENIKRGIINIFLRAVYLYDDRFTLVLNGSDTPITIDDILLDEIEEGLEGDLTSCEGCSSLVADAPGLGD